MAALCVHGFSVSLGGFGAGPAQDIDDPLGIGGIALHDWHFATRTFRRMFGGEDGDTGVDDDLAAHGLRNIGAWITGRDMIDLPARRN